MDDDKKELLIKLINDHAVFYHLYREALDKSQDSWKLYKDIIWEKLDRIEKILEDAIVIARYDQLVSDVLNEFTVRRENDEDFANEWPEDTFDAYFDQYKFDKINAAIVDKVNNSV